MKQSHDEAESFAIDLRSCLDAKDPVAALIGFIPQIRRTASLTQVPVGHAQDLAPHPLTGVGLMLVAGALERARRGLEIVPFFSAISDLLAPPHRYYAPGSNLSDILYRFPFLNVPLIRGAFIYKEQMDAVTLILKYHQRCDDDLTWILNEPTSVHVMAHPAVAGFGPFHYDRAWLLDQQEKVRDIGPLDDRLESVVEFDMLSLENALLLEQPLRGRPIIEELGRLSEAFLARAHLEHLGFNAVCLLAALERNNDAMALARHIVRRGYSQKWRFNLESAKQRPWIQKTRQNDWLVSLSEMPEYQAFLASDIQPSSLQY
jgi:hypothetical protein